MIVPSMVQILLDAGYTDGWAISGEMLVIWEHEEEPPAPLTRPEVNNETPSNDSAA